MRINNNLMAMNTHRQLGMANSAGAKSMEKLSSGYRINRAGDDAAGLAISEKMRGQIRGLNQASSNAQDGISLIQTAEGALNETHAILQRMRELSVQSATDTNTNVDRKNIQDEIDELTEEITRIADSTEFNTMKLLNGKFKDKSFHIGANEKQSITFDIEAMDADSLKLITDGFEGTEGEITVRSREKINIDFSKGEENELKVTQEDDGNIKVIIGEEITNNQLKTELEKIGLSVEIGEDKGEEEVGTDITSLSVEDNDEENEYAINVSNRKSADKAITTINDALETVSKERSKLGATQNRLEHTIKNLDASSENLQASESRIRDVDMAKEMMEQTRQNILQQASTAMLAQANMAPQTVLQLLG